MPLYVPSPARPVDSRLQDLAASMGLQLLPVAYPLTFSTTTADGAVTASLQLDSSEGPLFVTDLRNPTGNAELLQAEVQIRSGARSLVDGRVFLNDLTRNAAVAAETGGLPAPVVVNRGDLLRVTVQARGGYTPGDGTALMARGFHVRRLDGGRVANDDGNAADVLAAHVRAEGELYACGVVVEDGATTDKTTINSEGALCWLGLGVVDETQGVAFAAQLTVGNFDLLPASGLAGTSLKNAGDFVGAEGLVCLPSCAWPLQQGNAVVLRLQWSGAPDVDQTVRAVLLGRRCP